MTRREIEWELRQRAAAATVFGLGVGVCFLGMIVMSLAVVHLLHWMSMTPGSDLAWLPLWECHAFVAIGLILLGGVMGVVGRVRYQTLVQSETPIIAISQESVPWKTPQK